MNNKGFTLIELIAAITILSIIMLLAVPNVISVVNKNKNQVYINDGRKMVTLAKYRFEMDPNITRPTSNKCVIMTLGFLDRSELNKGPENGVYVLDSSFVVISYNSSSLEYTYRVQLWEEHSKGEKGLKLTEYSSLLSVDAKNKNYISNSRSDRKSPNNSITGCYGGVSLYTGN